MKISAFSVLVLLSFFAVIGRAAPVEDLPKSEILSIDRLHLTFTVKTAKTDVPRILQITSETRFLKEKKYAISEDLAVGDTFTAKSTSGRMVCTKLCASTS